MFYSFHGKCPRVDPTAFVSTSAELIGDGLSYDSGVALCRVVGHEDVAVCSGHCGGLVLDSRLVLGGGLVGPLSSERYSCAPKSGRMAR